MRIQFRPRPDQSGSSRKILTLFPNQLSDITTQRFRCEYELRCGDAVFTNLVFLNLLERHPHRFAQTALRHSNSFTAIGNRFANGDVQSLFIVAHDHK